MKTNKPSSYQILKAEHQNLKKEFEDVNKSFTVGSIDSQIGVSALGILSCATLAWAQGFAQDVHLLEPVYIRNKVAYTASERKQTHS